VARATVGDATFADLDMPLSVLAADLAGRRSVLMRDGPVAPALVAAMTVPGVHEPARRGDQRLVDAVVLAPVPTEGLTDVDVTIGVNLLGSRALSEWPGAPNQARAPRDRDPVVESGAAQLRTAADVPVTPEFGPGTWRDFHLADRYQAAGEEAMEAALRVLASQARPAR
jgi:predicted acylesterase/phospholipase RssA